MKTQNSFKISMFFEFERFAKNADFKATLSFYFFVNVFFEILIAWCVPIAIR